MAVFLVLSAFFFYTNLAFFITWAASISTAACGSTSSRHAARAAADRAAVDDAPVRGGAPQGTLELLWTYPIRDAS